MNNKKFLATWPITEDHLNDINFHLKLWQDIDDVYKLPKTKGMTAFEKASIVDWLSHEILSEHQYSNYLSIYEDLINWMFEPKAIVRMLGRIKFEIEIINPEYFEKIMRLYIRCSKHEYNDLQVLEYTRKSRKKHKSEC